MGNFGGSLLDPKHICKRDSFQVNVFALFSNAFMLTVGLLMSYVLFIGWGCWEDDAVPLGTHVGTLLMIA